MKTKKTVTEDGRGVMTAEDLAAKVIELETANTALERELKEREDEVIDLQKRCLTLKVMGEQMQQWATAQGAALDGMTLRFNALAHHDSRFSIRRPAVMEAIAEATGKDLVVCPRCTSVALAPEGTHRGERLCPACYAKENWPWPDVRWGRGEDGQLVGLMTFKLQYGDSAVEGRWVEHKQGM